MCYSRHMRLHIELEDELVGRIDEVAGPRGRSRFIREAIASSLENQRRRELIRSSQGSIGHLHEWDEDPGRWVRAQRKADERRLG